MRTILILGLATLIAGHAHAAPLVVNGSFEADAYGVGPGYAAGNAPITGWQHRGSGVGLNPWWNNPAERTGPNHSFTDNGKIPDGVQVALLQNEARLAQEIKGLEPGSTYVLHYHENARIHRGSQATPKLKVMVNGETVAPEHPVHPVDPAGVRNTPYPRVTSWAFEPDASGTALIAFETTVGGGVTVLLDAVSLEAVDDAGAVEATYGPDGAPADPQFPFVRNAGFEQGASTEFPGYLTQIPGWTVEGKSLGLNPWWRDAAKAQPGGQPFADNGAMPEGKQAAFIQKNGVLSQKIDGFRKGERYIVRYHANIRSEPPLGSPEIAVYLGGECVVSPHRLEPADDAGRHQAPWHMVESAPFTAPGDGAYELRFEVNDRDGGGTLLIDHVRVDVAAP